jgi:hypothetical protein
MSLRRSTWSAVAVVTWPVDPFGLPEPDALFNVLVLDETAASDVDAVPTTSANARRRFQAMLVFMSCSADGSCDEAGSDLAVEATSYASVRGRSPCTAGRRDRTSHPNACSLARLGHCVIHEYRTSRPVVITEKRGGHRKVTAKIRRLFVKARRSGTVPR